MKREVILVIANYQSKHLISCFSELEKEATLLYLYFPYQGTNEIKKDNVFFWSEFRNAFGLIKKLSVTKIIFFELETLNQICLNVAAKNLNIPTYFLDHGVQNFEISQKSGAYIRANYKSNILHKISKISPLDLFKSLNNRLFYYSTLKKLSKKDRIELSKYKKIRLENTILDTFQINETKVVLPHLFLCFNKINKTYYEKLHKTSLDNVKYIGFPEFDQYQYFKKTKGPKWLEKENVLFIDQPYVHFGYYGWNYANKKDNILNLDRICKEQKKTFLIKKHPAESAFWERISKECQFNFIESFNQSIENIGTVIGYNSTLLTPFAATHNIAVSILDNHPHGSNLDSNDLIKFNVATLFKNSLPTQKLMNFQKTNKEKFISQYLCGLMGKSKETLRDIVLS
tara:strand:- start:63 stop:1262 length:1200 start_codon:yes stop_codon:yes gene_type:complete